MERLLDRSRRPSQRRVGTSTGFVVGRPGFESCSHHLGLCELGDTPQLLRPTFSQLRKGGGTQKVAQIRRERDTKGLWVGFRGLELSMFYANFACM